MAEIMMVPIGVVIVNLGLLYYFLKHLWHIIKRICNIREKHYDIMTGEWEIEDFDTGLDIFMVLVLGSFMYFCYR